MVELSENAKIVLDGRYRQKNEKGEFIESYDDIWRRVAKNIASVEKTAKDKKKWEKIFYEELSSLKWMANSPCVMNAGTNNGLGYCACFVLDIEDTIISKRAKKIVVHGSENDTTLDSGGITDAIQASALITKAGGGIGYTLDKLRPSGDWISTSQAQTGGPLHFWHVLASMSGAMQQGGKRRGANMMTMSLWHPDILKFITAKDEFDPWMTEILGYKARRFGNFNISIKISDQEFCEILNNPDHILIVTNPRTRARYKIPKTVNIKNYQIQDLEIIPNDLTFEIYADKNYYSYGDVYNMICERAWAHADPGVIFWDRVKERDVIPGGAISTNPCFRGDQKILTSDGYKTFAELEGKGPIKIAQDPRVRYVGPEHDNNTNKFWKVYDIDQINKRIQTDYRLDTIGCKIDDRKIPQTSVDYVECKGVIKTGYNKQLCTVIFTSGQTLTCTLDHGIATRRGLVNAKDLLYKEQVLTVTLNDNHYKLAYDYVESVKIEPKRADTYCVAETTYNRTLIVNGIVARRCGEVPLPANSVCNLASIDISKFVDGNEIVYDKLEKSFRNMCRFLDNVVDASPYPTADIEREAKKWRRIGAGVMGIADALFKLGIPYDSEKALAIVDEIGTFLKDIANDHSVRLAQEKGSFPGLSESSHTHKEFRNSYNTCVAPTGCQSPDTIVMTSNGLLKLSELIDMQGPKWQNIDNTLVHQEKNSALVTRGFINGTVNTVRITTKSGSELECTPTHKYRIYKNGEYIWKSANEIEIGDMLVYKVGGYTKETNQALSEINIPIDNKSVFFVQPKEITCELAYIIGLMHADGSVHKQGIRIHFNKNDKDFSNKVIEKVKACFIGIKVKRREEHTCDSVYINSRWLTRFLETNGLLKGKAYDVSIPRKIRESSLASIKAFLEGYWDGDGSNTGSTRYIDTTSKDMAQQIQTLLRAIGTNSYIRIDNNISSRIGIRTRYRIYEKGTGSVWFNKSHYRYTPKDYRTLVNGLSKFGNGLMPDEVTSIKESKSQTLDIEVPENNTYIANSYVSHNTISIISNCSGGIEPLFSLAFKRQVMRDNKGNIANTKIELNSEFKDYIKNVLGFNDKEIELVANWALENGSIKNLDIETIRNSKENKKLWKRAQEIFVSSHDISWEWHVRHQAKWTNTFCGDNSSQSVSKTCNLPSSATVDDIKAFYKMAWELGCIGTTMYRDGSHDGQPMALEKKETELAKEINKLQKIQMPDELDSKKIKIPTSAGNMHVNVCHVDKKPVEVFAQVGKSGQDAHSLIEAICRCISVGLQYGVPYEAFIDQLIGIGTTRVMFNKGGKTTSIPDALGKAMIRAAEKIAGTESPNSDELQTTPHSSITESNGMICPDCGEMMCKSEGCHGGKCNSCGHSEC